MKKRQAAIDEAYEAQWDGGKGSHHPDYNPRAMGPHVTKATRETEELLNAIVKVSEPWRAALAAGGAPHHEAGLSTACSCPVTSRPAERHPPGVQED